jgi:hypothetical protein
MRLSETTLSILAEQGDDAAALAWAWLRMNGPGQAAACNGKIRAGYPEIEPDAYLWHHLWPEFHPLGRWGRQGRT